MITTAQLIAALLGFLCGSIMIAVLVFIPIILKKRSARTKSYVENEFLPQELAHSGVALIITFLFAIIAIFVYSRIAPDLLVWFGVAMVSWYLAGYFVYAFQKIVKVRKTLGK